MCKYRTVVVAIVSFILGYVLHPVVHDCHHAIMEALR